MESKSLRSAPPSLTVLPLPLPPLTAPRAHAQLDTLGEMDDNEEDGDEDEDDEDEQEEGEGGDEAAVGGAAEEAGAAPKDDAEIDDLTAALGAATV